ncbi:MFS transporter [Streptomyces atratus]|uniref:Predicted arabinose efflux permease, MFS family n=1 Tax=Streptomyces atratus TaxID=1893 RepID=A0A1K2EZH0_STRAR|nr:MFS transporter [Streptomyces atratus]SFY40344.1 Predicted arabinose efflux permease, MFS family [Streptomyces atratus]
MRRLRAQVRSFEPGVQLLMVNQFGINLGFYMLMPYLADHLAHGLGLAAWAVGLVLGVRNLSQQGMFWLGGTLADRIGYKPVILAGCALRTGAFALLAFADTLPALIAASAATGFAGALFNPAVRAYLAQGAGERRVEAFAAFNVFYQAGILLGPLAGLALLTLDFPVVCGASAAVFGVLAVVQARALPARRPTADPERTSGWRGIATDWRTILRNRPFVLFSAAMAGSYLLAFQTYLALPLQARTLLGDGNGTAMGVVFAVSALVAVAGQLRLTDWARKRLDPPKAIALGLAMMGAAFLPLLPGPHHRVHELTAVLGLGGLVVCAALLAAGSALLYPFEMDTLVRLSEQRLMATYYGAYSTVAGLAVAVGNLAVGGLFDLAARAGVPWLPWTALAVLGLACAAALTGLRRTGHLCLAPTTAPATA